MLLEAILLLAALAVALWLRPWRMLAGHSPLWTPLLATLVMLPWLWALPTLQHMPLQLQWSGACLAMLMLGWPLAMPVLCAVGALAWAVSPGLSAEAALGLAVWHGIVPATLAMLWGAALRRWLGTQIFVYTLGRCFFGTLLGLFAAGVLAHLAGHSLPGVQTELATIARWLMAWGDAVLTGMLCAVFVAFRPQWLATWSDALYLHGK